MNIKNILIVDDDSTTIDLMKDLLEGEGYSIDTCLSAEDGLKKLKYQSYKILITDLKMPGISGMELLKSCIKKYPELPVIMLTAHGTIESAVSALKIGAFDYITKPIQIDELIMVIEKAINYEELKIQNKFLSEELLKKENYFTKSENSQYISLLKSVDNLKDYDSTVLLHGETGTGKEVIARTIHKKSRRAGASFVPINCGAIPDNLIESELFGYAKGAFTDAKKNVKGKLEIADGGTLFLDEIEELSLKAQIALLRFLQEKEITPLGTHRKIKVNVRIIAATNKDLKSLISKGTFREDLFYRIRVFPLNLPPLRERQEDIIPLAEWFLTEMTNNISKQLSGFSPAAKKILLEYSWPGNIRELRNCIERAVIIEREKYIQKESLLILPEEKGSPQFNDFGVLPLKEMNDAYIKWVLEKFNNNKTIAASKLGISLRGLRYKLNKDKE
jgi:DNA-binding NtrC family response regulator